MHCLFNKKTFLGLVGFLLLISMFAFPGGVNKVGAVGENENYLPMTGYLAQTSGETVVFGANATWKYFDKGTVPASGWLLSGFDDSAWKFGSATLGYGDGDERTVVSYGSDANKKYSATFFRKSFTVTNLANIQSLSINLLRDDGAVVFLNGKEVARSNMPAGTTAYATLASSCGSEGSSYRYDIPTANLVTGTNTIAVAVHQCSLSSSDLAFAMILSAQLGTSAPAPTATAAPVIIPTAVPTVVPTAAPTAVPTTQPTLPPVVTSNAHYVTTSGTSSGDGSASKPWSLAYALSGPSSIRPGDTVWVRGGTYDGKFTAKLKGTSSAAVTVRAYPNERAILRYSTGPVLDIYDCAYLNLWGLEITSSYSTRNTSRSESTYGIRTYQSAPSHHVKFINMIVHDVQSQGFGWWEAMSDTEVYGSLFYFNGTTQLDHGIYLTNRTGNKSLVNSFVFDNASHGVHAYTEGGTKALNNIIVDGNTLFNNGSVGFNTTSNRYGIYKRNILVGGTVRTNYASIKNNLTYYPGSAGVSVNLGYSAGSYNSSITNNYLAGGEFDLGGSQSGLTVTGNSVFAPAGLGGFSASTYSNNTWLSSKPTGTKIFVRPNMYETNRANITIYNWGKASSVSVPASNLNGVSLRSGDRYELRNVQNYFSDVVTGTYNGTSITVPMTGHSVAQPVGLSFRPASTFPEFGGFVLIVLGQ